MDCPLIFDDFRLVRDYRSLIDANGRCYHCMRFAAQHSFIISNSSTYSSSHSSSSLDDGPLVMVQYINMILIEEDHNNVCISIPADKIRPNEKTALDVMFKRFESPYISYDAKLSKEEKTKLKKYQKILTDIFYEGEMDGYEVNCEIIPTRPGHTYVMKASDGMHW
jgi:hypothetical protein